MKKRDCKTLSLQKNVISSLKLEILIGGTSTSGSFCYTGCLCDEPK